MILRRWIAAPILTVVLLAGAADGAVLRGTVTGGTLPTATGGETVIRAVDVQSSVIVEATEVPRSGKWSMTVPGGAYSLITSVVTKNRSRQAITPVVRVRRTSRVRVPVSLRRTSAPRRRVKASLATPVVAVRKLSTTGPHADLGHGFSDMFVTEFLDDATRCKPTVVEWEKRGDMQRELDLGRYAPAPLRKRWIEPQVFVEGSLNTTADGLGSWEVRLRDAATGDIVGGDHGTLPPGGDVFETAHQIADRLVEQLCGATYDVSFQLSTNAVQATFTANGTISTTISATGTSASPRVPPTHFTGSGSISYANLSFAPSLPNCSIGGATSDSGTLSVNLDVTSAGHLRVTWVPSPPELASHASMTCSLSSGSFSTPALGPAIAGVAPTSFDLPVAGGSQALSTLPGVNLGGFGSFHSGTMIVTRHPTTLG